MLKTGTSRASEDKADLWDLWKCLQLWLSFTTSLFLQHTRRLVSAIWQRIVYEEYLQPILGVAIFQQFNLQSDATYGN